MLALRYHISPKAKITSGLCDEGRYIRIESRGSAVVLLMSEEQAVNLKSELPE